MLYVILALASIAILFPISAKGLLKVRKEKINKMANALGLDSIFRTDKPE